MTTFGTSAYLKLLALNPPPRDSEIRKRVWPSDRNGYDFHKAMRHIATEFAGDIVNWNTTRAKLKAIKKPEERKSAVSAVFALKHWVDGRPIRLLDDAEYTASPNEIFSIKFAPDFEINLNGIQTRVHIWNTKNPSIRIREAIGTLGLFVPETTPSSIAILSLRTGELFVPAEYESARELARILALDIERRFVRITEEGHIRPKKRTIEKRIGR